MGFPPELFPAHIEVACYEVLTFPKFPLKFCHQFLYLKFLRHETKLHIIYILKTEFIEYNYHIFSIIM